MFPKAGYHGMPGSKKFFAGLEFHRTLVEKAVTVIDITAVEVFDSRDNPEKGRKLTDCSELPQNLHTTNDNS